jgi:hypothetical protein
MDDCLEIEISNFIRVITENGENREHGEKGEMAKRQNG